MTFVRSGAGQRSIRVVSAKKEPRRSGQTLRGRNRLDESSRNIRVSLVNSVGFSDLNCQAVFKSNFDLQLAAVRQFQVQACFDDFFAVVN